MRNNTDYPIHEILAERYSPRAFDAERDIEPETIRRLFEAARWAPSSSNLQPWRYIVATRTDPAAFQKMLGVLNEGNQRWAQHAPLLLLMITNTERKPGRPNKNARYDLGQATAHLTFQAGALGLYLRQMGGIHPEKAQEIYGIPAPYEVLNAAAVGYAAAPETLPDDLAEKERRPRQRQPQSAFVFQAWDEPADFTTASDPA